MKRATNGFLAAAAVTVGLVIPSGCGDDDVNNAIDEGKQQVEKAGKEIDKSSNLDEKAGAELDKAKDEAGEGLKNTGKDLDEKNK